MFGSSFRAAARASRRRLGSASAFAVSSGSGGTHARIVAPSSLAIGLGVVACGLAVYGVSDAQTLGSPSFTQSVSHCHASGISEAQVNDLDARVTFTEQCIVSAAQKKNSAFVFIKPHAVTPAVKALVADTFQKAGITITSEGDLDYKTIDEEMFIDTHYGAIANRAVKMDPKDLIVPEKGQAGFEKMFGLTWESALASGKVFNAAQACEKLGIDGMQLDALWAKLDRKENLIKFGGGFYCGKIGDIYVLNGFYMSMRAAYTTAPATLHYYTVEWPAAKLSWEDFRGSVLGATDPATAAPGSARRLILEDYKKLGLKGKPNTGDNGVHASASPFEALAERMNWLKVDPRDDFYGQAMILSGVSKETLAEWSADPAVAFNGVKGSLFDLLEDLDSKECMEKAAKIVEQNKK